MASPLSPVQISQLKNSWPVIAPDPSQLALTLVIRMIRENPEYKLLFKRLKDVSIDEFATNPKFQAHASKVGATLVSIVNFLDEPEELEKLLTSIGSRHKKYGLTPTHFQVFGNLLVKFISETLAGDNNESELLDLWKSSLISVLNIVVAACF